MQTLTVIRDVGQTLKKFFIQNIDELSDDSAVVFDSPGDMKQSSTVKLSLFLYQVVPNKHLRNIEPAPMGPNKMQYPPLTIDLSYIFTPYAQDRETELLILEKIMQLLHDTAVFRDDLLQGNLVANGNDKIRAVPSILSLDDLNKLWGIFPNKSFKLSVSYLFTPVRIPSSRITDITRVINKDLNIYYMDQ